MTDENKVYELLKPLIIGIVSRSPGIKGVQLITDTVQLVLESPAYEGTDLAYVSKALELMVEREDIVEVEYVLKSMPYRAKSLYFPAGTEVAVVPPSKSER